MNEEVTEKTYPVEDKLLIKSVIQSIIGSVFFSFYITGKIPNSGHDLFIIIFIILAFGLFSFIFAWLWRKFFHYSLGAQFVTVRQGVISKTKRDFPYGVIQNIHVKQDLFDRALGITTIVIENASMGGGKPENESKFFGMRLGSRQKNKGEGFGISGNKVSVPGLSNVNAEKLKIAILQKMKDNPLEESHSGL